MLHDEFDEAGRQMSGTEDGKIGGAERDRRQFMLTAGRFATIVPPTMTILLSTSMSSEAIAASGGGAVSLPLSTGLSDSPIGLGRGPGGAAPVSQEAALGDGPVGGAPTSLTAPAGRPGQSLVAASPDIDPPEYVSITPSSKVASAGERG